MDWYETAQGPELCQGDILKGCPVYIVLGPWQWPVIAGTEVNVEAPAFDLVVMSQSCDLANDKIDDVLLARLLDWPSAVRAEGERGNEVFKSRKTRKHLVDGNVPGYSLLHKREGSPELPWSVVDFHRLYTLPKPYVSQFAASCGPRLRLCSPYREHLAQAFARYFMRVGLPHDAKAFEKEGDVEV